MRYKVGDIIRFSDPTNQDLYGAIGTIDKIYTIRDGKIACICNWTKKFLNVSRWEASEGEFELAESYFQREEAKKLLGLK